MPDYGVFVLAAPAHAAPIVEALHSRGLRAWSDCPEQVEVADARMAWADAVIVVDNSGMLRIATDPVFRDCNIPKILVTSTPLDAMERVWLLERHEFDNVLAWPSPAEMVAAFAERCVNRGALPVSYRQVAQNRPA
ncbi:MAG: hypothetical protein WC273_11285 [Dehalococcoidia bacterium]